MNAQWNDSVQVAAKDGVVSCELEGDSVLLDIDSSRYYRLNLVGSHIWSELSSPKTVAELRTAILGSFDVDEERCSNDLEALLSSLNASGLIEISDAETT